MASLACPECRKEMLAQKDYDRVLCSQCGRAAYEPGKKFQKIICIDCEDTNSTSKTA
jgi:ribosomal protein S27E